MIPGFSPCGALSQVLAGSGCREVESAAWLWAWTYANLAISVQLRDCWGGGLCLGVRRVGFDGKIWGLCSLLPAELWLCFFSKQMLGYLT